MRKAILFLSMFCVGCSALVGSKMIEPQNIKKGEIINGTTYRVQAFILSRWSILGIGVPFIPLYKTYRPVEIFVEVEDKTAPIPFLLINGEKIIHTNVISESSVVTYKFEVDNKPFEKIELLVGEKTYPVPFDEHRSWIYSPLLTM